MNNEDKLDQLFQSKFAEKLDAISPIRAHASDRALYRLYAGAKTFVGVAYDDVDENRAFLGFSKHFHSSGLPVPEIFVVSQDEKLYIEEDLGDLTLYDFLQSERGDAESLPDSVKSYYAQAMEYLPQFQIVAGKDIDYSLCHQTRAYDEAAIRADMSYFEEQFLERVGIRAESEVLHAEFDALSEFLGTAGAEFFLYRDFGARNIMVRDEKLFFIDYQSGRRGPLQYDVISLLFQSQARIPEEVREELLKVYLKAVQKVHALDVQAFMRHYRGFIFIRLMQVLGTYGSLGLGQGKEYFLHGIPAAIQNVLTALDTYGLPLELPVLESILFRLKTYDSQERRCQS